MVIQRPSCDSMRWAGIGSLLSKGVIVVGHLWHARALLERERRPRTRLPASPLAAGAPAQPPTPALRRPRNPHAGRPGGPLLVRRGAADPETLPSGGSRCPAGAARHPRHAALPPAHPPLAEGAGPRHASGSGSLRDPPAHLERAAAGSVPGRADGHRGERAHHAAGI